MIIFVRGNHGSGKSTVVRAVKDRFDAKPIYGILGPRNPEAYKCVVDLGAPLYILGPYESTATAGGDYITKKGVIKTVETLERYSQKGHVLFESVMVSTRFMAPSIGGWLETKSKDDFVAVTLTTTKAQAQQAINARQKKSINTAHASIHFERQQREFERVSVVLEEKGYRVVYASREEAPDTIMGLL